jgi:nicotinamide-nucleotide amidase
MTRPPGAVRPLSTAEIVAVGSELLVPPRLDTNSLTVTTGLAAIGIRVGAKHIVGDRADALAAVIAEALTRADLVVLTGGLGPTDDDVTRDAVSRVVGRPLIEDAAIVARLEARFAARGIAMPAINRRQAQVIEGAAVLDNPFGTAPGQWVEHGAQVIVLLPGPPRELGPMLEALLEGRLAARAPATRVHMRTVLVAGLGESHAEERLQPLYAAWNRRAIPIDPTILASGGQLELQLHARGDAAPAAAALEEAVNEVVAALGAHVVSTDGRAIEAVVGDALAARGWRIAIAESCTGGLVTSRLTDIPGSSAWVERAVVAYSNAAKVALLGVAEADLAAHGAVSETVAVAMAEGARRLAGVEVGVGITGIAGPSGGTATKPVGTVFLAVVRPGMPPLVRTNRYPGERIYVKTFASLGAIDLVRRALAEDGASGTTAPGTWEQAGQRRLP